MAARDNDDPLIPRRKPFEIEGDWGEPGTKKYDTPELRLDASAPVAREVAERPRASMDLTGDPRPPAASLEERVEHLEKMNALLWKVLHQLQGKAPQDPEER